MKKQTTGRRVQIYLPADLLERWDATPRYERSAEVAAALRQYWGAKHTSKHTVDLAQSDEGSDTASGKGVEKR